MALAVFLPGARVLVFFSALGAYGPEVTASYGSTLSLLLVVMSLGTAYQILVVARLRGETLLRDTEKPAALAAVVLAGSVFLTAAALVAGGGAFFFQHSPALFAAYYLAYLPAVFIAPLMYAAGGILVVTGQEGVRLRTSVENFAGYAALAVAVFLWQPSPVVALAVIGAGCSLIDLATLVRTVLRTEPEARSAAARAVRTGARSMFSARVVRSVPGSLSGAFDVLVLVATFALVAQIATSLPVAQAAATVAFITVIRTLVVPLKPYGMVAGRLLRTVESAPEDHGRRMRLFTVSTALLLWPIALLFLAAPGPIAGLLGLEQEPMVLWGVRLVGVQLLMEPWAGFLSSVLKVVVAPHATVRSLVVLLWCTALPVIALLALTGLLNLLSLWLVLVAARAGFALSTVYAARRFLSRTEAAR
ncbi:MMPL family transporter [Nocardiopsis dassonvillei subsp. albirubida]|uniref:MMPL family transporter n=2 Tax=Nocardiopsis alborubida TaxID=146802 RepID=A0A7X6MGG9_9ACTN|nr:MMPL family transporter [Nocardiopsis alborubida]